MYYDEEGYVLPHYTCCSSALNIDMEQLKSHYREVVRELMRRQKEKLKEADREDLALSCSEVNDYLYKI